MKTAAEHYDEAEAKAREYHSMNYVYGGPCPTLPILLRQYRIAAIEAAVADARVRHEGHGEPCYYCKEPCNNLAGNPGLWAIVLCHSDEPGVPKFHHGGCVAKRLHDVAEERARWLKWATDKGFRTDAIPKELQL